MLLLIAMKLELDAYALCPKHMHDWITKTKKCHIYSYALQEAFLSVHICKLGTLGIARILVITLSDFKNAATNHSTKSS